MRISKLLVIGLLGCCLTASAGCAKKEIKNLGSKGKNIICFGDSITYGYGVSPKENYPSALTKMLSQPVINSGIDADTTTEGLERIKADVLDRSPLIVIIAFTGNDFLRKIPMGVTVSNIKKMVDLSQAKGAMVAIVDISAGLFLREYRQALSVVAKEKQAIFIPAVLSGIITNPNMKSDFIHPNGEGYKMVAQRIFRAIKPYLKENDLLKIPQKENVQPHKISQNSLR